MSSSRFPVGLEMDVSYPDFHVRLTLLSVTQLRFEIREGPFAKTDIVDIQVVPLGNGMFAVSWKERDGATVTNVQDYDRGLGALVRDAARRSVSAHVRHIHDHPTCGSCLGRSPAAQQGAGARGDDFALFQRHDVVGRGAPLRAGVHPAQPRDSTRSQTRCVSLVANLSQAVFYEPGLIVAEGDLVAIHGRIRGWADTPQVVVDLFRDRGRQARRALGCVAERGAVDGSAIGGISMFDPDEAERTT